MPQLNIKNDEAHRLATEIARRTGDSVTGAVLAALREKHRKLPVPEEVVQERLRKMRATTAWIREKMGDQKIPYPEDVLYDEHGLPK